MNKLAFTIFTFILLTNLFGQKTEYGISLNSGIFSFRGKSAVSESFMTYQSQTGSCTINNHYGSHGALCYGLSANIKRVTKKRFVLGLDIGYELLRSNMGINSIDYYNGYNQNSFVASGQAFLNNYFININPQIGYRLILGKLPFDIVGGFDIAHYLKAIEKGNATASNGMKYSTTNNFKPINTDIRPRFQISSSYKRVGTYIGYSFGLANYMLGYVGGTNDCYARILRFGLTYRLK